MIKIEVTTHSGVTDVMELAEYNEVDTEQKLNDNEIQSIKMGRNIYSRVDVKNIRVIEDGTENAK